MGMSGGGGAATVQRGGGRKRRRRRMVADINITPLVDVMLVLLVIFIVTAPSMTKEEGLAVDVPHAKGTAGGGTNAVSYVVSIDATGKVSANGVIVEPANIDAEIPKLLKGAENQIVTVRADTNARHGSVIKVLSAIRSAGIVKINFAVSGEK